MRDDLPAQLARDLDAAFPLLVEAHQHMLYGLALRMLRNREEAEEVAQDALVRAYRALARYETTRIRELLLRPWLARICVNLCRNRVRRSRPPIGELDEQQHASLDESPEAYTDRIAASGEWARRLDALPPRQRAAVLLRHVAGLSYEELALALARPVGTVKADVHRGLRTLRDALAAEELEAVQ
jgi:RNA polymerase sigma factor (sigma-70 family)